MMVRQGERPLGRAGVSVKPDLTLSPGHVIEVLGLMHSRASMLVVRSDSVHRAKTLL
jgi:hypothetical protein